MSNDARHPFAARYAAALQEYLADAGEAALEGAYELGHDALAQGLRIPDLAAVHHDALNMLLRGASAPGEAARTVEASAAFLMESLSPFEMTHRGFLDANATLRSLNQTLAQRVQEVQTAHAQTEAAERRARFLAEASMRLSAVLDYRARLALVAQLAVPALADYGILDAFEENGEVRRVEVAGADPETEAVARDLLRRCPGLPHTREGASPALGAVPWGLWPERPDALLAALVRDQEPQELRQKLALRSGMVVPLQARGRTLARLTLLAAESGRRYGPEELAEAEEFAHCAAITLDNARLYHEVQEAAQRKDEFLAMLAHELRNPLAAILNAVQVMGLRAAVDPALHRARDVVHRQVRHMARLLDDLLDVSRITHGKIQLRKESVDLAMVAQNALQTSRPFIEAGRHEVTTRLPAEPLWVDGDATRLEQVLTNLLNNAAKYTAAGGCIGVSVEREGRGVVVRVSDTGAGISPELLPRIFDLFTQADRSLDRSQGGLGIGLTLVRRLVELHGGSVEATSAGPGLGSEFAVRLPEQPGARAAAPAPVRGAATTGERRSSRVLLVEDNLDAAETLAELLKYWGHEVRVALDGPEALAAARADPPEVVLLDIGLPGMDGYEVARRLQESPDPKRPLLVALTGYGGDEDRRRAREAGFDHHLTKPVDFAELDRLLGATSLGR